MSQPAPTAPLVLALDVGGTTIKGAAYDASLISLARATRRTPRGAAIVEAIGQTADDLLAALSDVQRRRVSAAGVAIPGVVDPVRGVSVRAVNLDLTDVAIAAPLQERLALPVTVGHDVRAAGEAELRVRPPELVDPFVVVIGTGIAAVAFVDGKALAGVSGRAGELGHVVVRPDGPLCGCGARGCLEAIASAGAITRRYNERSGVTVGGAEEVVAVLGTDPAAAEVWDEAVSALADGLLTVCLLLAPGAIVLGGGLADAGEVLTGPLRDRLRERSRVAAVPPLLTARLGSRAGEVGAALLAFDRLGVETS